MIWFFVAILVIAFVVLVVMIMRKNNESPTPVEDLASLTVADAQLGDMITVLAKGDNYDDLSFSVDRVYRYESGGEHWFELSGKYLGRRVFLEVSQDDDWEVSLNATRNELSLAELGVDEEKLIEFDERQDRSSELHFEGSAWRYTGSREVLCQVDNSPNESAYYGWEFQEVDGDRTIFIEKYEGEPFEVGLGERVHPDDVRIFRA